MKLKFLAVVLLFAIFLSGLKIEVLDAKDSEIGWVKVDGLYQNDGSYNHFYSGYKWMYFDNRNTYKTGWNVVDGNKYYFSDEGIMATGLKVIDSTEYVFESSGKLIEKEGWVKIDNFYWVYVDHTLSIVRNEWKKIEGEWYYFDNNGKMLNAEISNDGYLLDSSGKLVNNTWVKLRDGRWALSNKDGKVLRDQWKWSGGHWYYFNRMGMTITGASNINGKRYLFDENSKMQEGSGWRSINNNYKRTKDWYYLNNRVPKVNSWGKIENKWYYFNNDSIMLTTLSKDKLMPTSYEIDSKNYVFNMDGSLSSDGWFRINKGSSTEWAYANLGKFKTSEWLKYQNKWYYFDDNSLMYSSGVYSINGVKYSFDSNGAMIETTGWNSSVDKYNEKMWTYINKNNEAMMEQWQKIDGYWYYFGYDGRMVSASLEYINNKTYVFDRSGAMLTEGWHFTNNGWVYLNNEDTAVTGWFESNGDQYFADNYFGHIKVGTQIIDGVIYEFDSSGKLID